MHHMNNDFLSAISLVTTNITDTVINLEVAPNSASMMSRYNVLPPESSTQLKSTASIANDMKILTA